MAAYGPAMEVVISRTVTPLSSASGAPVGGGGKLSIGNTLKFQKNGAADSPGSGLTSFHVQGLIVTFARGGFFGFGCVARL